MIDIVSVIKQHTDHLTQGLGPSSISQRKDLVVALVHFFFQLPGALDVIKHHFSMDVEIDQIANDILNENTKQYHEAIEKANAKLDPYADDYEELEPIEAFILDNFSNAVEDLNNPTIVVSLFIGVINTLDYYEGFSEDPVFWNRLLEKEVEFQNGIITLIKSGNSFDHSAYFNRYKNVDFGET